MLPCLEGVQDGIVIGYKQNSNASFSCEFLYNNIGIKPFSFGTKCVDVIIVHEKYCSVGTVPEEQY